MHCALLGAGTLVLLVGSRWGRWSRCNSGRVQKCSESESRSGQATAASSLCHSQGINSVPCPLSCIVPSTV